MIRDGETKQIRIPDAVSYLLQNPTCRNRFFQHNPALTGTLNRLEQIYYFPFRGFIA